jgi:hypothetical protein
LSYKACQFWKSKKLWHSRISRALAKLLTPDLWNKFLELYEQHSLEFPLEERKNRVGITGSSILWALTEGQKSSENWDWIPNDIDFAVCCNTFFPKIGETQGISDPFKWHCKFESGKSKHEYYLNDKIWNYLFLREDKSKSKRKISSQNPPPKFTYLAVSSWTPATSTGDLEKIPRNVKINRNVFLGFKKVEDWINRFDLDFCKILWTPSGFTIYEIPSVRDRISRNTILFYLPELRNLIPEKKTYWLDIEETYTERNKKYRKRKYTIIE